MGILRKLRRRRHAAPVLVAGSDYASYMSSPAHTERLYEELGHVAEPFLRGCGMLEPSVSREFLQQAITDFFALYPRRPVAENVGGSRFHNCFWLYLTARCLDPQVIVESGTWKGQSSWVLRQACPGATLHCFDLSFEQLEYRDPSIVYHENDWQHHDFGPLIGARSLCFFDDHVNQAQRVREAHGKGFRRLLFDDNPPAHKMYSFGYPGLPTIDMLMDGRVREGEVLEWVWKGERRRYVFTEANVCDARRLIQRYAVFPDVAGPTKYGWHAYLAFVELGAG